MATVRAPGCGRARSTWRCVTSRQHSLELRAATHEVAIHSAWKEPTTRSMPAGVPAGIEGDDLAGVGQMWDVAMEVPLRSLSSTRMMTAGLSEGVVRNRRNGAPGPASERARLDLPTRYFPLELP